MLPHWSALVEDTKFGIYVPTSQKSRVHIRSLCEPNLFQRLAGTIFICQNSTANDIHSRFASMWCMIYEILVIGVVVEGSNNSSANYSFCRPNNGLQKRSNHCKFNLCKPSRCSLYNSFIFLLFSKNSLYAWFILSMILICWLYNSLIRCMLRIKSLYCWLILSKYASDSRYMSPVHVIIE